MINVQPGILIALEGIDGSGKTTLAQFLAHQLTHAGYSVVLTKEPGGTEFGKHMRAMLQSRPTALTPQTEFLLFAADRAQHMQEIIRPALSAGKVVISDRLSDSSVAYQGYGRGVDVDMIKQINSWIMGSIKPTITVYLELDSQTAYQRIEQRKEQLTDFEKEQKSFFERVIHGFETLYKDRKDIIRLDARQKPEIIAQQALGYIYEQGLV